MHALKSILILILAFVLCDPGIVTAQSRPPRPRPPTPRPHPPRPPRPRPIPMPRPVPRPIPHPRPVPPQTNTQACFYEYENFQGRQLCVRLGESINDLSFYGLDNRISSAIIPPGFVVGAYEFPDYYGNGVELSGVIYDLSEYGYHWDDVISSFEYYRY